MVVRKCFRMVGGVLVERTVKDVLPALVSNKDKMGRKCVKLFSTDFDNMMLFKENLLRVLTSSWRTREPRLMDTWRSTTFS